MEEVVFNLKDFVYLGLILTSALTGFFTVKSKTEKNKIRFDNLQRQLDKETQRTDELDKDVKKALSILNEIKGMLKKQ